MGEEIATSRGGGVPGKAIDERKTEIGRQSKKEKNEKFRKPDK